MRDLLERQLVIDDADHQAGLGVFGREAEQRDERFASAALYPTSTRAVVAVPASRCRCPITPGMTYDQLRDIAAGGSCTGRAFLCPDLDRALRKARARLKEPA